eukprot:scaffold174504_cov63-Attheya_sp.AAC.4
MKSAAPQSPSPVIEPYNRSEYANIYCWYNNCRILGVTVLGVLHSKGGICPTRYCVSNPVQSGYVPSATEMVKTLQSSNDQGGRRVRRSAVVRLVRVAMARESAVSKTEEEETTNHFPNSGHFFM